jgi:tetratricopeptide (TPR) repeat protein
MAVLKAKSGKFTSALVDLNKFISVNPKDISSRELRVNIYNELGEYKKALNDNLYILSTETNVSPEKKAINLENTGYDYLLLGDYTSGRRMYQKANELVGNNINTIFNIGYSFKKDKIYDSSIVYFNKVLLQDKNHTLSLRHKIQALNLSGKSDQAFALSDEFLNSNKFDIDIILTRASIFKANGKIEMALNDYTRAFVSNPDDDIALFGVSECYVALGYYEEDLILKKRIVELFKKNKESNTIISNSLFLLGIAHKFLGEYENAIKSFDEAESLNPNDVLILLERGLAKASIKDLEGACVDFKKASILDEKKTSEYEEFISDDAEYADFANYCTTIN